MDPPQAWVRLPWPMKVATPLLMMLANTLPQRGRWARSCGISQR